MLLLPRDVQLFYNTRISKRTTDINQSVVEPACNENKQKNSAKGVYQPGTYIDASCT